jgi:hypothetical protein
MALFARIPYSQAEDLMMNWPSHRWMKRSIYELLNASKSNIENIAKVPVNPGLLESVKKHGFESPFLVLDSWYPICGSQRLRVAMEMPEKWQKKEKVWVCRFDNAVYKQLFAWPNQKEAHEAVQRYFQMCEVVFKTLYMPSHDSNGKQMLSFEEEGNHLHWPTRDGNRPLGGPVPIGMNQKVGPPSKKKMVIPSL